jgi:hypothetical protein
VNVALHIHTLYSACAETKLEQFGDYCRKKGVQAIGITDHDTTAGAIALKSVIGRDVRIIVGEEIKTRQGEIIGLFLNKEIEPGLEAKETVCRIKEQGGIVYIPHPFDPFKITRLKKRALMEVLDMVDIIEVFNAKVVLPVFYVLARNFASRHNKLGAAGSDAHYLPAVDACLNEIAPFSGPEEFLRNFQDARLIIGRSPFFRAWWVGIKNVLAAEGHFVKRYGRK